MYFLRVFMCTICITRFLICVYSLAIQHPVTTSLVSQSHDQTPECLTWIVTFQLTVFQKKMQLVLDRLVLQYTYTTPLQTLTHRRQDFEMTLLNAFSLN